MSSPIVIIVVLLATISLPLSSADSSLNDEDSVAIRFYANFTQIVRPITKLNPSKYILDQSFTYECYRFNLTETEYSQISIDSLTVLDPNVTERIITYHSMPNFEQTGSRYFYRRDPKSNETIEIELLNPKDRLFREVHQPNRYFYLKSFDDLEYSTMPVMPYYNIKFYCNISIPLNSSFAPFLSYNDSSFQWTPRYTLDVLPTGSNRQIEIHAFADIRNNEDIKLYKKSFEFSRNETSYSANISGIYLIEPNFPSSSILAPYSTQSIPFLQDDIIVNSFNYYSGDFLPVNSTGKLLNAFNITSNTSFIPNGRILINKGGKFIAQTSLPNIAIGEIYTSVYGYNTEVSYRRKVTIVEGDEDSSSTTYYVEYIFKNSAEDDARIYFIDSFHSLKYFQIKNISSSGLNGDIPDFVIHDINLRGYFIVPSSIGQKTISYSVVVYKTKSSCK
ncbi:unnamed protein product [Adineta steineri]|uniref:Uncharacterized protein n=1 Tax=Adineta steineri TaxID=433720 RepID=A0A814Z9Y1_9BILA|nr:unnamed protein product [Adineta steineri]